MGNYTKHQPPRYPIRACTKPAGCLNEYVTNKVVDEVAEYTVDYDYRDIQSLLCCRLKRHSQIPGIDYHDTFSPTTRMSSIRVLLQHAVQNDTLTHQMDVKTAYLNAPIDCEIFMEQSEGYEKASKNGEKLEKLE